MKKEYNAPVAEMMEFDYEENVVASGEFGDDTTTTTTTGTGRTNKKNGNNGNGRTCKKC